MTDRVLGLLGLMRKASALSPGEDSASDAVLSGKAKLLLLPSDAGDKKKERAEWYTDGRSCLIVKLPYTESQLSESVGTGGCTMAAVTDMGFADSLMQILSEQDPELFSEQAEQIHAKFEKQKKRKIEKPGKPKGKK